MSPRETLAGGPTDRPTRFNPLIGRDAHDPEEQLIARLRTLPPERVAEVLDFAEFLQHKESPAKALRPMGLCAGTIQVPDDFDAPLPEEELRRFES